MPGFWEPSIFWNRITTLGMASCFHPPPKRKSAEECLHFYLLFMCYLFFLIENLQKVLFCTFLGVNNVGTCQLNKTTFILHTGRFIKFLLLLPPISMEKYKKWPYPTVHWWFIGKSLGTRVPWANKEIVRFTLCKNCLSLTQDGSQ